MRTRITATYMSGPQDGRTLEWELPRDAEEMVLTIGRREGSDILLDYDSQVSRSHAQVIYHVPSGTFYLEDAGSRNGTFVGSDKIRERKQILPGDLFRVGRTWLRIDPDLPGLGGEDLPF